MTPRRIAPRKNALCVTGASPRRSYRAWYSTRALIIFPSVKGEAAFPSRRIAIVTAAVACPGSDISPRTTMDKIVLVAMVVAKVAGQLTLMLVLGLLVDGVF